jgi:hypothetical protein
MNHLLEYIAGTFTAPRRTFAQIAHQGTLGAAVFTFSLSILISGIAGFGSLSGQELPIEVFRLLPLGVVSSLLFGTLGWLLQTAVYHLFAEFLGGVGRATSLFKILPFTSLPGIILTPLNLILTKLGLSLLGMPISLVMLIWVFILQLFALQAVYGLSTLRTIALIFLPLLLLIAAVLIFGITIITTVIPLVMEAMPNNIFLPF